MTTKQNILDWLFRLGLYWGARAETPNELVLCSLQKNGSVSRVYMTAINENHDMADWLLNECEGPWAMRLRRPFRERKPYLAFARSADAMLFRLMQ